MEQHYTNIPFACVHKEYNIAHFADDIYQNKIWAYQKDASGAFVLFEPSTRGIRGGVIDIINMIDKGELYFERADLMMVSRDVYKFKVLELEPRIEEKDALIAQLKNSVSWWKRYTTDIERKSGEMLASFGLPAEGTPATTAQEAEPSVPQPETVKRGAAGRQKANLDRLREWQTVFLPAMIKAAVALGGAGPQSAGNPRQRKDVQVELDKHLAGKKAPKAVLDMLYKSLPDEYVDRKGGNSPIKPKTPSQV